MSKIDSITKAITEFDWDDYGLDDVDPASEYAEWVPDLAAKIAEALGGELAEARTTALRDLIGDPDADGPNGILDRYGVRAIDRTDGKPYVVWHCDRDHGDAPDGHVGIIARDLNLSQDGLLLAELVDAALTHEEEAHHG